MIETVILVGVLLALLFFFHARARREQMPAQDSQATKAEPATELLPPSHVCYYAQIRQALARADREYLAHRATPAVRRRWEADRRTVVRGFLAGLKEDYVRLERLGRTVASLSPELSHELERERLWLGVRFRFWYGVLWVAPLGSRWTLRLLDRTTNLVGSIADRTAAAMTAIGEATNRPA